MPFNSHNSDNIEIKPRFKLVSTFSQKEIFEKIKITLPSQKEVEGTIKGNHVFLNIPTENQHYWSPAMEVIIEELDDDKNKTSVRCLIGPRQTVWMMLMFFYVAVGVLGFFGGIYGLAKWNLGKETLLIWAVPLALLLFVVIYLTAKYGQRKGRDQMLYLVSFLYHAIDDKDIIRL
ncbi:MAG: hypothetical protein H6587_01065 [Flavobacteriales bacterium]|nr:hypothetical protein [Flavobacteriales bacterium]MCB9363135.1 hypothetical protein [Flavobacteriales bacterium]